MKFYIGSEDLQHVSRISQLKGDVSNHSVDCNVWADDNGALTTATWTVESGQATLSNKTLTSNVASADFTTSESGNSMIKLLITDGTNSKAIYIHVRAKDPQAVITDDYGMVVC